MKIESEYRHTLKSSRRFVLENIMDLEHVCALHRKWFSNLRVRVRRPDYVEYRMTSRFYGIKQELLVRGGPIDEDHYWYEFLSSLANIRVDGELAGPDGALEQTERITYEFHWTLAPLFWLLRPVFRRQKNDILHDDTQLLERVYELERKSFRRLEPEAPKVVVYGGSGFFGRLLVEDILQHSSAHVAVAARNPRTDIFKKFPGRVTFFESDAEDEPSVLSTIDEAAAVVCCTGPYQGHPLTLLKACIRKKIHYVDVADDRDFVERAYALGRQIEAASIRAFIGCSVVPGVTSLLTHYARAAFPNIDRVRIAITPGTRKLRGPGSFHCLLSTIGDAYRIPAGSSYRLVEGWTGRQRVVFPDPVGPRWTYLVVDIADYFTQVHYFQTPSVEFRIGAEFDVLNRMLSLLRWVKKVAGLRSLRWSVPAARRLIGLASRFGSTRGAVMVEVSGRDEKNHPAQISLSVYAEERGEVIPALLASLAVQSILKGETEPSGIVPLPSWVSADHLATELNRRGIRMAVRMNSSDPWADCSGQSFAPTHLAERSG